MDPKILLQKQIKYTVNVVKDFHKNEFNLRHSLSLSS
jgi:hypothetical protein